MNSEETTETVTSTKSSGNGRESRELTEIEQKYYEVLKLEHQKWKKMIEKSKKAVKEARPEIVRSEIAAEQKEKFEKHLSEIEKYFSQIDDLDCEMAKSAADIQRYEQLLHKLYATTATNVYKDINMKVSNYV